MNQMSEEKQELILIILALIAFCAACNERQADTGYSPRQIILNDLNTYYFGQTVAPISGTITRVDISLQGKPGSSEPVAIYLVVNDNVTDVLTVSANWSDLDNYIFNGFINREISGGDQLMIKVETPLWHTNPILIGQPNIKFTLD
jgi:hypothetical protein